MKLYNWLFLLMTIPAIWTYNTLHNKIDVQGTIIGMNKDQVQAGKTGARDRFLVAVKYSDRPSDSIEVPFHYYLEAKVGDSITHKVNTVNHKYEGVLIFGGAIMFTLAIMFGIFPFLWEVFMITKRFKSKYSDDFN